MDLKSLKILIFENIYLKEDSGSLVSEEKSKTDGKKLNKPFRTPGESKKFAVYVRDPQTKNIKKVRFGDPNMKIKRYSKKHRDSFRARHGCDKAKDKTTAKYWSCYQWRKGKKVEG